VDVMVTVSPSSNLAKYVSLDPLDIIHASASCLLPSPCSECCDFSPADSHVVLEGNEVDCSESPGTFRGYDPSLDPCSLYLEDMPGKIMLTIGFDYSTKCFRGI